VLFHLAGHGALFQAHSGASVGFMSFGVFSYFIYFFGGLPSIREVTGTSKPKHESPLPPYRPEATYSPERNLESCKYSIINILQTHNPTPSLFRVLAHHFSILTEVTVSISCREGTLRVSESIPV
jgi:hypothetical protein